MKEKTFVEKITAWIGSTSSLVLHTIIFAGSFALAIVGRVTLSDMLLFLTTVVSLEAIYLSIFIQMTVNRHTKELAEVSEDVEDIQEDIDEIQKDVDEIQEDVEEISEDVDEIQEDVEEISEDNEEDEGHEKRQADSIEQLTKDVRRLLEDLETLKKG